MRVLVTGGAGYVGFSLVRRLATTAEVEHVRVVDNLARGSHALFVSGSHGPVPVEFRKVDILDGYSLDAALEGVDTIFHLAAHATTPDSDAQIHIFDQVNNWGSAQVARSIEKHATVERVLYLSSFAIYGQHPEPVDEQTTPVPTSGYGISKLNGEAHMRRLGDRTVYVVRAGNVFGFNPAIRFDSVVNALAFDAWTQRRVRISGDGSQTRPFIEVGALAETMVALALSGQPSGTFNVATHNAAVNEIADVLAALAPGLEQIHVNREIRMQDITMRLPVALSALLPVHGPPFADSIEALVAALRG